MADLAVGITLTAGSVTFVNQWYQSKTIDWKVPVATVILAAGIGAVNAIDVKAATILSVMILMGAATTKFNGKSVVDTITDLTKSTQKNTVKSTASANATKTAA